MSRILYFFHQKELSLRIVLATSNKGKVEEIKKIIQYVEVVPYTELMEGFDIEEHGDTFKKNAIIKSETIYEKLDDKDSIVLSDDSGISVEALEWEPGIYSARYAKVGASDKENLEFLIKNLKDKNLNSSKAFYTCAIAITSTYGTFTTHGYIHGLVIDTPRGDNGFGYDPIFIPQDFDKTLGELPWEVKKDISHRGKALELARIILRAII